MNNYDEAREIMDNTGGVRAGIDSSTDVNRAHVLALLAVADELRADRQARTVCGCGSADEFSRAAWEQRERARDAAGERLTVGEQVRCPDGKTGELRYLSNGTAFVRYEHADTLRGWDVLEVQPANPATDGERLAELGVKVTEETPQP